MLYYLLVVLYGGGVFGGASTWDVLACEKLIALNCSRFRTAGLQANDSSRLAAADRRAHFLDYNIQHKANVILYGLAYTAQGHRAKVSTPVVSADGCDHNEFNTNRHKPCLFPGKLASTGG